MCIINTQMHWSFCFGKKDTQNKHFGHLIECQNFTLDVLLKTSGTRYCASNGKTIANSSHSISIARQSVMKFVCAFFTKLVLSRITIGFDELVVVELFYKIIDEIL